MTDLYPTEFSNEARNNVERERLIAAAALKQQKAERRRPNIEGLVITCSMRITNAFTDQGAALVRDGVWTLDQLRKESREFLRLILGEIHLDYGRDCDGHLIPSLRSNWDGSILDNAWQKILKTREYADYEDKLLNAAPLAKTEARPIEPVKFDWGTIEIVFLSELNVQIFRNGKADEPLNYAELGFADRRTGKNGKSKPTLAWGLLRAFAENSGSLEGAYSKRPRQQAYSRDRAPTLGVRNQLRHETNESAIPMAHELQKQQKMIQSIREALKKHFQTDTDPISIRREGGYRTNFKIRRHSCDD